MNIKNTKVVYNYGNQICYDFKFSDIKDYDKIPQLWKDAILKGGGPTAIFDVSESPNRYYEYNFIKEGGVKNQKEFEERWDFLFEGMQEVPSCKQFPNLI